MSTPTTSQQAECEPLEYRYTTWEGERRKVLVGVDSIDMTGAWSVYDVPVGGGHNHGWLVERLEGYDEKLEQARALAAEYAADQQRFHDGERGEHAKPDPLTRPVIEDGQRHPLQVPLAEIRKHAALARRQAAPAPQPIAA